MKKTMTKWFWAWDFDKEEKWLNDLAAKGINLESVAFCKYTFSEGTPGEYQYRLELLENFPAHAESEHYIRFLEDTGAEHIANVNRWVYFRKKVENGPFDIFSDLDSKISHLKRIFTLLGFPTLFLLITSINNLNLSITLHSKINLFCSIIGGLFSLLCIYGIFKIQRKIAKLKRERSIHE